jgi:O-antigen ligase
LLGIQVLGIVATFSRGAWAAAVAGGGILLLPVIIKWMKHPIRLPKALIASLVLAFFSLPLIFANSNIRTRLLSIFTPTQVNEFTWRVAIWDYAGKQILRNPILGTGTSIIDNTIVLIHDPNQIESFSTHNLFFDLAYQRGLIVLALYLILWIVFFKSAWNLYKSDLNQDQPERKLMLGLISGGIAYMISGIGNASMMIENLATLFWFLFGVIIVWERINPKHKLPSLEDR